MAEFVMLADLKNPATGKTWREENNALTHKIPLDTLVEVKPEKYSKHNGIRAYVASHDRDCDGTPLYSLTMEKGLRRDSYGKELERIMRLAFCSGMPEEGLIVLEEPVAPED
jgi:hypothetical protein